MTYNIRRLGDEKSEANLWRYRKKHLIKLIKKHDPDILCLQEDHPKQVKDIKNELHNFGDFGFYNEDINTKIRGEANTIIFNSKKIKILEKNYFNLTEIPNIKNKPQEQSIYHRTVTHIKIKLNGKNISVFNTHFDHLSPNVQKKEAEILRKIVISINPNNYIICGDFNGDVASPQLKILMRNFNLINKKISNKKSVFDWSDTHSPRKCIDFIFSNIKTKNVKIDDSKYIDTNKEQRMPSDHLPIISELEV